jgi:hypothetical protein
MNGEPTGQSMRRVLRSRRPLMARLVAAAFAFGSAATLAGCSSVVDHIPTAVGGIPEGAPERPAAQPAYPAVHSAAGGTNAAQRNVTPLTDAEREKLKQELIATRARAQEGQPAPVPDDTTGATSKP